MWARITIFFAVALVAAVAGGAWFGHLLAVNAPQSPIEPRLQATLPVTGADAAPVIPEPPQPRMDGTLGVPEREPVGANAEVPLVSVLEDESTAIAVQSDRTERVDTGGLDNLIASLSGPDNGQAPNGVPTANTAPQARSTELPPELAFAVARPATEAPAWLDSLRASLGRCGSQRFFSPAECEQRLRVQYCDPNGGWGRVPECPAAQRNVRY